MDTIIIAIIGSGALSAMISGIFNLINEKSKHKREITERMNEITQRLKNIEVNQVKADKDQCRTQLLLMIADYPEEKSEIMKLAEHYFEDLSGNWYLTSLFNRWLEENNIKKPEWFKEV